VASLLALWVFRWLNAGMIATFRRLLGLALAACAALPLLSAADGSGMPPARSRELFDAGWRFAHGHAYDSTKDFDHGTAYFSHLAKAGYGDGPAAASFDDRAWRELNLPHDWAVEAPFAPNASHSHGYKAVGRNFPERSVGWYRKSFHVPASDFGRRISIEFDGIHRDSVVWINGFYLGRQPSGSTGFRYDLTDYLRYGDENVISVRADVTTEEGWYYEGAGISRHVWLTKTAALHVPQHGVFVSTEGDAKAATITIQTLVRNEGAQSSDYLVRQQLISPSGASLSTVETTIPALASGDESELKQVMQIENPRLWNLEDPSLHRMVTTILVGDQTIDRVSTTFGVRSIRLDPDKGLFLNGQHVLLKGVNMHQDHAGVGTALPDSLVEYRIRRLKEMGANAYRTSHEPPSPVVLEACDRLGMLILVENRLMGPSPEQLSQLAAMIRRDRNHPSVFLWSLGNEEWAIEGNDFGARITASMRAFAERLDPTRRTTVAISGGWGAGSSTTTDVMGYNYYTHGSTDEHHARFPQQPSVLTEETTTQCTRGIYFTDRARGHLAHDTKATGDSGANCLRGWQHVVARPYLAGLFFWTGFDYRGESTPFAYPAVSSQFGLMDTCGFAKDSFHYLKAWWTSEPVLHLYPHWNWAGREGQAITVGCYTNHEEVELLLNGSSLGRKAVPRNDIVEWSVPYEPGRLEARGFRGGKPVATTVVETTGAPVSLELRPDRTNLKADGRDATVVAIEARDSQGRLVPTACLPAKLSIKGARILGVGNGDPSCLEPDQFIPETESVSLKDWKARIAPGELKAPSSETLESLLKVGDWKAPLPKENEKYELSASLQLDRIPEGEIEVFLPSFGKITSFWLNGHSCVQDASSTRTGPSVKLESSLLRPGENKLRLIVVPHDGSRRRLPQLTQLGVLRISRPAAPVQRSLFNGLAQVIIQAPASAGTIELRAEAEGLKPAQILLKTGDF